MKNASSCFTGGKRGGTIRSIIRERVTYSRGRVTYNRGRVTYSRGRVTYSRGRVTFEEE